ncbi:MAG: Acetyl-coenzyme A synthetase [Sodalis sp.]|nr:MAG: Acetyl-coenzyme A synthetase [Sodalis sp.]
MSQPNRYPIPFGENMLKLWNGLPFLKYYLQSRSRQYPLVEDGTLNVAANCLDRHLPERGDQTTIIWEGSDVSQSKTLTYCKLHKAACRFDKVLNTQRIGKGDVVAM